MQKSPLKRKVILTRVCAQFKMLELSRETDHDDWAQHGVV